MRVRPLVLLLSLVLLAPAGQELAHPGGAHVSGVSSPSDYPEAVEPGVLTRLCAGSEGELRALFAEKGAPFDPHLVHSTKGRRCHVDYAPTIPGFRADPEDRPVRELFVNVDGAGFLARRTEPYGDVLDISKALVAGLPRSVTISLGTEWTLADRWYEEAVTFHYGDEAPHIQWRQGRLPSRSHPWTQDYLKGGRVGDQPAILVTRRLFEGRREDGEFFRPMLDALPEERFVRSNLSWEGGDLQFVRDPRDPAKLVLLFGDSARAYWGGGLSPEEYAYVLRREFGADVSVDLSGLVPHVDYFVAFLPADRIALVSQPLHGDREVAEAAAAALEERFAGTPPDALAELRRRLALPDALSSGRRDVERLVERAKTEAREGWPRAEDPGLAARMGRHIAARCPASPEQCFTAEAIEAFLLSDLPLLRDWASASLRARTETAMDLRLLSVVEGQLARGRPDTQGRIEDAVRTLEEMGLQVVRVPRLGGDRRLKVPWSGISYVNSLLVDRTLFVPRFGLGPVEERIFGELDGALPPEYVVVPVYARHMLLNNGGVHCSVAIVRE